jgi:hypothetical protein
MTNFSEGFKLSVTIFFAQTARSSGAFAVNGNGQLEAKLPLKGQRKQLRLSLGRQAVIGEGVKLGRQGVKLSHGSHAVAVRGTGSQLLLPVFRVAKSVRVRGFSSSSRLKRRGKK